jgi:bifunctional oligoribonuclease and PAP phosphatase NrnA
MNYQESQEILSEVQKANKILLNCHHYPDADSVGSALSMYHYLISQGKEVSIICPNDLPDSFKFLPASDQIKKIDFSTFDFSKYELFITMDTASWHRATGAKESEIPQGLNIVVIDHHITNHKFGSINLIDADKPANCEILYLVFEDWKTEIDQNIATCLLSGIIGDTGGFRYPEASADTLQIGVNLMQKGANKNEIIFNLYKSYDIELVKFWTEILRNIQVDKEYGFVYASITKETYEKFGRPQGSKSEVSDIFFQNIKETNFGMVIFEENDGEVTISFRSRTDIDVSILANTLGGGGHAYASAARVYGLSYDEALKHILSEARQFAKSHAK